MIWRSIVSKVKENYKPLCPPTSHFTINGYCSEFFSGFFFPKSRMSSPAVARKVTLPAEEVIRTCLEFGGEIPEEIFSSQGFFTGYRRSR